MDSFVSCTTWRFATTVVNTRVKLPKRVREEPKPPPVEHVLAILEALSARWRLLFVVVEQGALRIGEAVHLTWGDVDPASLRLRLPRSATKRDTARWVYLPEWLLDAIEATCPLEDITKGWSRPASGSPRRYAPRDDEPVSPPRRRRRCAGACGRGRGQSR